TEDQIDIGMGLELIESLLRSARGHHSQSTPLQKTRDGEEIPRIIVHEEDFPSGNLDRGFLRLRVRQHWSHRRPHREALAVRALEIWAMQRQIKCERAARSRSAFYDDLTTQQVRELATDGEAQACSSV